MEAWRQWLLGGRKSYPDEEQKTNLLDSDRPSHGRPFHALSGKVDFERNRDISPIDGTLGSVTLQPVKTYALQNISSCTSASTELEKLLPAQRTPWLLKTHDGDVIAYFKVLPKENGSEWHGHCVTADVSGRHYNEDAAVISALRQLQLAVGGEITDDNGSVVRFLF